MKKLFVGNISFQSTEDSLKSFFEQIGPVLSVKIIIDRATGRSKGFAFVEMENDAEADRAIAELNGKELDGRTIVVNEARPMEQR